MLRDITKVLVGIVLSDMLVGIWLISADMLPIKFLGLEWAFPSAIIAILAEFLILILLVYYSWFWKKEIKIIPQEDLKKKI
jgi:hypothetical protein